MGLIRISWTSVGPLLLSVLLGASPARALDLELASIASVSVIGAGMGKRVQRSFESGGRPTLWSLLSEIKSKPLKLQGRLGRSAFRHPVHVDLSLSTIPSFAPGKFEFKQQLDLAASRRLADHIPPMIEVSLQQVEERSTVKVLCKFKF